MITLRYPSYFDQLLSISLSLWSFSNCFSVILTNHNQQYVLLYMLVYASRTFFYPLRNGINVSSSEARTLKSIATANCSLAKLTYRRTWKFDCTSSSFNDQLDSRERVLPPTKNVPHRRSRVRGCLMPLGTHLPFGEVKIRWCSICFINSETS